MVRFFSEKCLRSDGAGKKYILKVGGLIRKGVFSMKKNFIIGIIVSAVLSVLICVWADVAIPRMFYTVPLCAVVGGAVWTFFSWLAHVMPFLESFSEGSGWFTNFVWTYVGKPLLCSALTSYTIIGVLGVGGTKNSSKEEESKAKNEETGMYYNLSDEETERLATLPVGLQGFVVV